MATQPAPASTMPNPYQPTLDLARSLNQCAMAIDNFIGRQPDPYSAQCQQLRAKERVIVDSAYEITSAAIAAATDDLKDAIGQLQAQVDKAQTTLRQISDAKKAISIAAAVLAAAAGIASGGIVASIPAIIALAGAISDAAAPSSGSGNSGN